MYEQKPWLKFYQHVPYNIDYPRVTMYEALKQTANQNPDSIAYDFLGYTSTYRKFISEIDHCADALAALGLGKGERITISMPTSPQGIICFYAANKLGAVASMIHPLSTAKEIEFYLNVAKSRFALTLDAFYSKFKEVQNKTPLTILILARIPDYLSFFKRIGFNLTKGRQIPKVPQDSMVKWWADLMRAQFPHVPQEKMDTDDMAAILYSGGTTGIPKGIMLSNMNFISEGMQVLRVGKTFRRFFRAGHSADIPWLRAGCLCQCLLHGWRQEHPCADFYAGNGCRYHPLTKTLFCYRCPHIV